MRVVVDVASINDWDSFHEAFSRAMGFPDFYGRNMDAWIDCMSYVDEPEAGMSKVGVVPGEILGVELKGMAQFAERCPEILVELVLCSAFVNKRFVESGSGTRVSLITT